MAGIVDPQSPAHVAARSTIRSGADVDVAIDFTSPDAVVNNVPALARRGINIVLGTTGWQAHEAALRAAIAEAGTGIVAAPNFSTGVVLFEAIVARGGAAVRRQPSSSAPGCTKRITPRRRTRRPARRCC